MISLCRDCLRAGNGAGRCVHCASPRTVAHAELASLTIAHLDCDAFYASVEKRDRPDLRDRPVVVGGGKRGVVTAACYIARTYGVRSAMPMFKALKACPEAVVIKPDFAKYKDASRQIMDRLRRLTPLVQQLALDEAWLDMSGTEALNGGFPALVLARTQAEIERQVGITVSIGLAANKVMAKMASEMDKPRGFCVIGAADAKAFLDPKPVTILPGVGPAMAESLRKAGLSTVGAIAETDPKFMAARWGAYGLRLVELSNGRDARTVDPDHDRKGISAETTFENDLTRIEDLEDRLWFCCEKVAARLRAEGAAGRVATLKLKTPDFKLITRRRTLPEPIQTARGLFSALRELLRAEVGRPYRLIGAGLADITGASDISSDLFGGEEVKARKVEKTIDGLRAKLGKDAVVSGRALRRT